MKRLFIIFLMFINLVFANQFTNDGWQSNIPTTATMYKKMGVDALKQKDINQAIKKFHQAIKEKDDYYLGHYNLAIAHYLNKDLNSSYNSLKMAYSIAKKESIKDVNIYILFGYANMVQNREKEAKAIYEEGLALDSDNSKLLNNYGLLLFRNGDYKKAREYFKKSLDKGYYKAKENIDMIDKIITDINKNITQKDNNLTDTNTTK